MLFNSLEFLIFLSLVYALYRVLPFRAQNHMLLVSSYIFYGWWDWRFLFLMILSTTTDFWTGLTLDRGKIGLRAMIVSGTFLTLSGLLLLGLDFSALLHAVAGQPLPPTIVTSWMPVLIVGLPLLFMIGFGVYSVLIRLPEEQRRKACVAVSLIVQLGILGTFKYYNFFADSLISGLHDLGFQAAPRHIDVLLPIGISFYTFQSLSYAIDIYRREIKPTDKYFDFALFVAFFPQLVAGPINRAKHLIPQLSKPRQLLLSDTTRGLFLIVLGLFKKIAIADGVAPFVDQVFGTSGTVSWSDVVAGTMLFAVQIYCDFSGYSDIARGVAKLFGVDLMVNFNLPYFAKSPRDFWQRWHISLSTWLSDYLYKPLGGSRGSLAFTCRNLMLTMLLGGLWHGAAWNYVLWGLYHGSILTAHRVLTSRRPAPRAAGNIVNALKIFAFGLVTLYGWLLFRARSFDQIADFTRVLMTDFGNFSLGPALPSLAPMLGIVLLSGFEIAQYRAGRATFYQKIPLPLLGLLIAAMIFLMVMGMSNEPAQFIYFQF